MAERECITNYRVLPLFIAAEVAKYFHLELQLGKTTRWGVGKWFAEIEPDRSCGHWGMCVSIGEKRYIPHTCFKTRREAEEYCVAVGKVFPQICQSMFGIGTEQFSSN